MDKLLNTIQEMRISRGWDKSDTLPILIKSVSVEAAELLETIQWDEENIDMEAVKGELADVLMYALSICIDNDLDVQKLIEDKIQNVYMRYPEKNG
ncbi:MAG: nucleotide pyrophosphohydrolase [Erysipelotrichaceae bacterium]|nr:nucleotide pyrophosphohydrolase [Erysipelotrichaceae bacterium]MBR2545299.1 dUTP diphosphatase [Erysipelotrichaceae bacterium]